MSESEASDAEIIKPDVDIEVAGETVTVRRFRYFESLSAARQARALLAAIAELPEDVDLQTILDVIADHPSEWIGLLAMSCGRDPAWIRDLDEQEGHLLAMTFWQVNRHFFALRLLATGLSRDLKSAPSPRSANSPKPEDTDDSTKSPSATRSSKSSASSPSIEAS